MKAKEIMQEPFFGLLLTRMLASPIGHNILRPFVCFDLYIPLYHHPDGLQVGGGITLDNAQFWIDAGAAKVKRKSHIMTR